MHRAVFVQQQRAVPGHAYQHVVGTLGLQAGGGSDDLVIIGQLAAHDLGQLVVVGLDEERLVGQHLQQQVLGGVYHSAHAAALQPGQQPLVGGLRQAGRDAARQNQHVVFLQRVQLGFHRLHGGFGNVRPCAVQLGLLPGLDLDIDACHPLLQVDEIGVQALGGQAALQPGAGLARDKAESHTFDPQLGQHAGYIDALAAQHAILAGGAVDGRDLQRTVQPDDVVDGGVKCNGIDHASASFTSVCWR